MHASCDNQGVGAHHEELRHASRKRLLKGQRACRRHSKKYHNLTCRAVHRMNQHHYPIATVAHPPAHTNPHLPSRTCP